MFNRVGLLMVARMSAKQHPSPRSAQCEDQYFSRLLTTDSAGDDAARGRGCFFVGKSNNDTITEAIDFDLRHGQEMVSNWRE